MTRSRSAWALNLALLGSLAAAQTTPAQSTPAQTTSAQVTPPAPQPAPTLTLAQVLGQLTQAPGWRSAALQYLSASQNLDAARARAGLSVSVGADVSAVQAPVGGDWTGGTTLNVQAALNVLPWSSAQGSVLLAMRALARAGFSQRDSHNALALTVVQGYLNAQQAAASLSAASAGLALATRQLEVARSQQQGGLLTQEGLLAVQVSLEQAVSAEAETRSALDLALSQLDTTLGLGTAPRTAAPVLSSRPAVPAAPAPLDTLLAHAAAGRSEVLSALSAAQDAQTSLDAARLDRSLPALSLSVQYGQLGSSTGVSGNTVSSSLNLKTGQLTAGASVPLTPAKTAQGTALPTSLALGLSGSYAVLNPAADAVVRGAETSVASAALSLASARASVDLDVRQKYAQLQNALLGLTAPRTALTRAQTVLSSAQARLQAGLATPLDVQQAALAVQQARNALDAAVNGAYLASLSLSVATAEFSPALIVQPDSTTPGGQP